MTICESCGEKEVYFENNGRKIKLQSFIYWRGYADGLGHYRAKYKNKILEETDFKKFKSKLIQLLDDIENQRS